MSGDAVSTQIQRALEFFRQGSLAEAEAMIRAVTVEVPAHAGAWLMLGAVQHRQERHEAALLSLQRALEIAPNNAAAHYNRGQVLQTLGRLDEAVASYDRALEIDPHDVAALNNRGAAFLSLKRPEEALTSCDRALALQPGNVQALNNRGAALLDLKRAAEAFADYDRALALQPSNAELINNRGGALLDLKRYREALAAFDQALGIMPNFVPAWLNRAEAFIALKDYAQAIHAYDKILELDATAAYVEGDRIHAKMHVCDWSESAAELTALGAHIDEGRRVARPFMALASGISAARRFRAARIFAADKYPVHPGSLWRGEIYRHDKIRLGYVSGEFREQATAYLAAGLYECHDRTDFIVHALSTGLNDKSAMRARLEAGFDVFTDVSGQSDREIAEFIRRAEIDILIDLNGYFGDERTGIFALRPTPMQVNYLGFPGTMGAPYMDYIIADPWVVPDGERGIYSEKIVSLVPTYQPNDRKRRRAAGTPSRKVCGLPDEGFVFACFNNVYKITPSMFDVWMRLLAQIEGSVLWLLEDNPLAVVHLRREAVARGIAPERIVFAPRRKIEDHLARHRLADIFLDTLPYNAHTTASDALWAGLPVVTCSGESFAGRVAGSLLRAIGLPELITESLDDYEALALRLARDSSLLAAIRKRLACNRDDHALFDTERYTRHLETAYRMMAERYRSGLPPADITVDD